MRGDLGTCDVGLACRCVGKCADPSISDYPKTCVVPIATTTSTTLLAVEKTITTPTPTLDKLQPLPSNVELVLVADVLGATRADDVFWAERCTSIPSNTLFIVVDIGTSRDFYKPIAVPTASSYCNMLQANNKHQWSPNGIQWFDVDFNPNEEFNGGSAINWPQGHDGDKREFLSFWGFKRRDGGCCSSSRTTLSSGNSNLPFAVSYAVEAASVVLLSTGATTTASASVPVDRKNPGTGTTGADSVDRTDGTNGTAASNQDVDGNAAVSKPQPGGGVGGVDGANGTDQSVDSEGTHETQLPGSGLSTGATAGIITAGVLAILAIVCYCIYFCRRKRSANNTNIGGNMNGAGPTVAGMMADTSDVEPHSASASMVVQNPAFSTYDNAFPGTQMVVPPPPVIYGVPFSGPTAAVTKKMMYERLVSSETDKHNKDGNTASTLASRLAAVPFTSLLAAVAKTAKHCKPRNAVFDYTRSVKEAESFGAALLKKHANRQDQASSPSSDQLELPPDFLAGDVAVIHTYTQDTPLYRGLNGALGGWGVGGTGAVEHYLPYAKLLTTAFGKLPTYVGRLFRGVRLPLAIVLQGKVVGDIVEMLSVTSASTSSDVLRDDNFLGMGDIGERTVFQYAVLSAVQIKQFSAMSEDEVVIVPGSRFVIDSIKEWDNGVTEVQMHQLPPEVPTRRNSSSSDLLSYVRSLDAIHPSDPLAVYGVTETLYEDINDYLAPGEHAFNSLPSFVYDSVDGMYGAVSTSTAVATTTSTYATVLEAAGNDEVAATVSLSKKCARGDAPAQRACSNNALPGSRFCSNHKCSQAACANSKSSSDSTCLQHLPPGVRQRASSTLVHGTRLLQNSPPPSRGRAATLYSDRCARGDDSGGKLCSHRVAPGNTFCINHRCDHPGCTNSKSSSDKLCLEHTNASASLAGSVPVVATTPSTGVSRTNRARASGGYGFVGNQGVSVYQGFNIDEDEEV